MPYPCANGTRPPSSGRSSSCAWPGKSNADRVPLVTPLARPYLFWSTDRVAARMRDGDVRVVDCRFSFDEALHAQYLGNHLPGAVYVSWASDLSAPPPASGHPRWMLLGPSEFAQVMSHLGIGDGTMVIGYDAEGGHHAARLWLPLRRFGHRPVAGMEGGIQKGIAEGRPLESGVVKVAAANFTARPREGVIATEEQGLTA